jgi:putative sterol carrier protein
VRYLSPSWIRAAGRAIAGDDGLRTATAGMRLTIEYVATDAPEGTIRWHITIDDGRVALAEGPATQPDLRMTADYATAAQIARGELGAQRAFAEGRLRVGGDLSLLIRHHRPLAAIDDVLGDLRALAART